MGDTREQANPEFSFGVIADVQYADVENAQNFSKTQWRYYRNSLNLLKDAIADWNTSSTPVSFVLQLGDIIDGFNRRSKSSQKALDTVLEAFSTFRGSVHHLWGNHELYNFRRSHLRQTPLNTCANNLQTSQNSVYYDFSVAPNFRFVILDVYEVSKLGYERDHPFYVQADSILGINPNEDQNSPVGLAGNDRRFVLYNGGISKDQLCWFDQILQKAELQNERVIVGAHQPVFVDSTDPTCLSWSFADILATMHRYKCVVAYLSGHDHDGGYAVDSHGIHHITMHGVIETPPSSNAYGTVHVYKDKMELHGVGRVPNRSIPLPHIYN